ncbi:MAG: MFS transporter [Pseudomonadota bacterium]
MSERRADRYSAWGLTWVAYASYYFGRKGFSVVKSTLRHALGVSEHALGVIDTLYLGAYALGLFFSGYIGDRVGARRLIGAGLCLSAACCAAFGATSSAVLFGALFFVNGLAQSTGWPGTTSAMAAWTTRQNRGTVMAFWCTCYQVGSIVASDFAGYLARRYGWRAAFFGPSLWMVGIALVIVLFLKNRAPEAATSPNEAPHALAPDAQERHALQRKALQNPILWSFGASYFFIKYVRYALLFWLPYYLSGTLGYAVDRAAYVSNAFEAGGIAGVILLGILSDRMRRVSRATLSIFSLLGLAGALLACAGFTAHNLTFTVVALALVGALLFGPDALLSGAAAQDVGGVAAAATATGLVNGVGSIGGMLEGVSLPAISARFGWHAMFPLLAGLAVCAALALIPAARRADTRPA